MVNLEQLFKDENLKIVTEYLSNKNDDLLDQLKPALYANTFYIRDFIEEYAGLGFKVCQKTFGELETYRYVTKIKRDLAKTFLTEDEFNFIRIFKINDTYTERCLPQDNFLNLCKTSEEFLLKYFDDFKEDDEITYCLALIAKGLDLDKYKLIEKLENATKETIYYSERNDVDQFNPNEYRYRGKLNGFENVPKWIFVALVMNKTEFLDKMCVIFATNIYSDGLGEQRVLNKLFESDSINVNKKEYYEFTEKYPVHQLKMLSLMDPSMYDLIPENKYTKEDFLNEFFQYDNLLECNRDFLLEKTDIVDFAEIDNYNKKSANFFAYKYLKELKGMYINLFGERDEFVIRIELVALLIIDFYSTNFEKWIKESFNYKMTVNCIVQLLCICCYEGSDLYDWVDDYDKNKEEIDSLASFFVDEEFVQHAIKNYKKFQVRQRLIIIRVLAMNLDKYKDAFIQISENSKSIKPAILFTYEQNPELIDMLLNNLKSKKAPERKKAFTVLTGVDDNNYLNEIKLAFDVEDNEKLKADMEKFLSNKDLNSIISSTQSAQVPSVVGNDTSKNSVDNSIQDIDKIILALNKNDKLIKFLPLDTFTKIENISNEELTASLITFAKEKELGLSPIADKILENADKNSLEKFSKDLLDFYIENNAESKHKWILFYCSIYGGEQMVDLYVALIKELVEKSRGAVAGAVVKALSLNNTPKSLFVVEEMSRKFKHKQVKKSALESLDFIASELNISKEELADRLIPDFGFDEDMKLEFDYGTRKFKVYLNTNLDLSIEDEKGKVMKNLPKVGANDTTEIAQASVDRFKEMKKLIKVAVKSQSERLELALSNGRTWTYENFEKLFVKNPIMYNFATSLIWGVYENGDLKDTFRYSDDGTFSTVEDDEFTLKNDMIIGLIHPIELDEKLLSSWKELLNDYEIKQSILQLDREVFKLNLDDVEGKFIKFDDKIKYSRSSLKTNLTKAGFETGMVLDGGYFNWFEHNNLCKNIKATLEFSGMSIVYYGDDEVDCTLDKLNFKDDRGSMEIKNVPVKIISEIYNILSKVTVIE